MGDYLEMFLLTMFFFVGAPTNLIICRKLWARRKSHLAWFQMLQHLNFSDLLVLWVYSPCRIGMKLFQHWYAGILSCKIIMFFEALPFYISSNIIVCIAVDKVLSYRGGWHSSRQKRVRNLLTIGWIIAIFTSAPQLWWYSVYDDASGKPVCVDAHFVFRSWSFGLLDNATFFNYCRYSNLSTFIVSNRLFTGTKSNKPKIHFFLRISFFFMKFRCHFPPPPKKNLFHKAKISVKGPFVI